MTDIVETFISAEVSSFQEFEDALHLASVNSIKLLSDITFTRNITEIPLRDVTVDAAGNAIDSNFYTIYGATSSAQTGNLTFTNAKIVSSTVSGRIFEHNSTGWNVNFKDVTYFGARLVHLSRGTLTFDGKNEITTTAENAWVENLIFKKRSEYKGIAGTISNYSAFYFNGSSKSGKAIVERGANVTIDVGDGKYSLYPAFFDRIDGILVEEAASLTINSYGYAVHFTRADMAEKAHINVAKDATLTLNSHGGGGHETVRYDIEGQIVVEDGGKLYVSNHPQATSIPVFKFYKNSKIVIGKNTFFKLYNKLQGAPLFNTSSTGFSVNTVGELKLWTRNGGDYETAPLASYPDVKLSTLIEGDTSFNTSSTDDNLQESFQMSYYGCIGADSYPPL